MGTAVLGLACCQQAEPAPKRPVAPPETAPFCDAAARFVSRLGPAMAQDPAARATNTESLWRELTEFLRDAARSAPAEVRPDAEAAAAVVSEYYAALERARFVAASVPRPIAAKLEAPEFVAATSRLAAFSRQACGTGG